MTNTLDHWVSVGPINRLKREKRSIFRFQQKQVLLLWMNEQFFAIDNKCPHQGFPLESGSIDFENFNITCPYHNWSFDLISGKCLFNTACLSAYPLEIREGNLWIQMTG
jgi:nitrite reductase/ring-hydroxylating ferredoxin subunit